MVKRQIKIVKNNVGNRLPRRARRGGRAVNRIEAELNVVKSQVGQMQRPKGVNQTRRRRNRRTNIGSNINTLKTTGGSTRNGVTTVGKILRAGGAIAGGFFGNATAGSALGAGISRIFGQGDYTVTNNSLVNGGPPSFAALNTGMRVAHREYVRDILGSVAFTNQTFQITPTNSSLFPWLSRLAFNFEEYRVHGLVFYFNTTCGNAISSTNNALGVVGMTTVYDPSDPDLASKREAEDYGGCVSGVPSCSLLHPVECKPRSNVLDRMYVQVQPADDNDDLKFYSHGKLNVFTQGMQIDNVNIGELWVSYDIEFFNPKILPVGTVGAAASKISASVTSLSNTQIFGTANHAQDYGNLGVRYDGPSGNIVIPSGTASGYYFINWTASFSAGATVTYTATSTSTNVTLINFFQGNSVNNLPTPNASAANAWHGQSVMLYKSDALEGTVRLSVSSGTESGNTKSYDLVVMKVPYELIAGGIPFMGVQNVQKQIDVNKEEMEKLFLTFVQQYGLKPISEIPQEEDKEEDIRVSFDKLE